MTAKEIQYFITGIRIQRIIGRFEDIEGAPYYTQTTENEVVLTTKNCVVIKVFKGIGAPFDLLAYLETNWNHWPTKE